MVIPDSPNQSHRYSLKYDQGPHWDNDFFQNPYVRLYLQHHQLEGYGIILAVSPNGFQNLDG